MIMGAPMRAVTLLTGMAPSNPGARAIRLQINAKAAPHRAVAGISFQWSLVRNIPRAKWGTAIPMNMMGPQ